MYDIYFDLQNMHQTVSEKDDAEEEFWKLGEQIDLNFFDEEGPNIEQSDDFAVIVRRSNGCTCKHCGEIYPYAEPNQRDGSFKCWSCRNF